VVSLDQTFMHQLAFYTLGSISSCEHGFRLLNCSLARRERISQQYIRNRINNRIHSFTPRTHQFPVQNPTLQINHDVISSTMLRLLLPALILGGLRFRVRGRLKVGLASRCGPSFGVDYEEGKVVATTCFFLTSY
jgi:hypothetical protein